MLTSSPPPPRMSYGEAARRHYSDAEHLLGEGRRINADHLYGIAAECALIGILQTSETAAGLFRADGGLDDRFRAHINALWNQFCKEAQGRRLGVVVSGLRTEFPGQPRYPGDRPLPMNPFQGWSVDQRYLSDVHAEHEITDDVVKRHRRAAMTCLRLLDDRKPARPAGSPS